ncbi:Trafficking protein particle complex subunit [Citrus sinensis]|nr:Trafficking protein particle complex subunit [Citrus sinensis]
MAAIYSLYIINKSGGLIFYKIRFRSTQILPDMITNIAALGTKFFVVCEPGTQHMESLLKVIYELYTDYVLKNPFYEMEMPIRCELFDINLSQAVQKDRVAMLGR